MAAGHDLPFLSVACGDNEKACWLAWLAWRGMAKAQWGGRGILMSSSLGLSSLPAQACGWQHCQPSGLHLQIMNRKLSGCGMAKKACLFLLPETFIQCVYKCLYVHLSRTVARTVAWHVIAWLAWLADSCLEQTMPSSGPGGRTLTKQWQAACSSPPSGL